MLVHDSSDQRVACARLEGTYSLDLWDNVFCDSFDILVYLPNQEQFRGSCYFSKTSITPTSLSWPRCAAFAPSLISDSFIYVTAPLPIRLDISAVGYVANHWRCQRVVLHNLLVNR